MMLLERHIAKSVLAAIAMVTFLLSGLQVFVLFIKQIQDLGGEGYGLLEAAIFVLLQTPQQVYNFFPILSLMGALIGLGVLANHRELVVMRASGMSIMQITLTVLKAAFLVVLLMTFLGESLLPKLVYYANNRKMQAITGGQTLRTSSGVWLRSHNDFIFVGKINSDNTLEDVYQFHFNHKHQLTSAKKIQTIQYKNKLWEASGIEQTEFLNERTQSSEIKSAPWDALVQPSLLKLSTAEPDEMTLFDLHQYLQEKRRNHQTAVSYQLAYFQRLLQPFATAVMMLLAIPFIFGSLRSSTMGSRFILGAAAGFSFYILSRLFNLFGQIFQLPPLLIVPIPILLFALLGLYMMRQVR
jgi:lipopolysaccharide export system permease protein